MCDRKVTHSNNQTAPNNDKGVQNPPVLPEEEVRRLEVVGRAGQTEKTD
jgi:hypothetical protein